MKYVLRKNGCHLDVRCWMTISSMQCGYAQELKLHNHCPVKGKSVPSSDSECASTINLKVNYSESMRYVGIHVNMSLVLMWLFYGIQTKS